jgi:hypothetical protein
VSSLSNVGGGGGGVVQALQSGVLKFFDEYNYDKLGITCRLRGDVCEMSGVEPAPNGYYIVKGKGNENLVTFSVIGGTTPNGCYPPGEQVYWGGLADPAFRYSQVATRTGGVVGSIYDPSFENTLVRIAIQGSRVEPMSTLLTGPTAVIWSNESPSQPAKIATKIAKTQDKFVIKGGYFDGQVLDAKGVESLATMPGKDELRASLLMTFLAAPTDFVRTLAAGPTNFLYVLQARERALGENS